MTAIRLLLAILVVATLLAAPRSAERPTVDPPSGDLIPAGVGASVDLPSGAPGAKVSERPRGSAATTSPGPRPTAGPTPGARSAPHLRPASPAPTGGARPPAGGPRATARPPAASSIVSGRASWYDDGPGFYAATHEYRDGTSVQAVVCAFPGGRSTCVTVQVITQCGACRMRPGAVLIDLSPAAFRALGYPLSVGLVRVTVEVLG